MLPKRNRIREVAIPALNKELFIGWRNTYAEQLKVSSLCNIATNFVGAGLYPTKWNTHHLDSRR